MEQPPQHPVPASPPPTPGYPQMPPVAAMRRGRIVYTGEFWPWFGMNIVWFLLTVVTLGIFGFYMAYWNAKYFVAHLELELPAG
jgi:uncharacterized membrane protein YjgN (DUF898 family)